jgi:uncharacterized repeat protein (TIGR02543 family)
MGGPKSIRANFIQNQYTLTVMIAPLGVAGSVTKNPDKTVYVYGDVVTLTAVPSAGYTFDTWSGGRSGTTNPVTLTMDSNKTVTANFAVVPAWDPSQ